MPKNNDFLARQKTALVLARKAGYAAGAKNAIEMFELIVPIALNDVLGVGADRANRVNAAINDLFAHYTKSADEADADFAKEELRRRAAQIMKREVGD